MTSHPFVMGPSLVFETRPFALLPWRKATSCFLNRMGWTFHFFSHGARRQGTTSRQSRFCCWTKRWRPGSAMRRRTRLINVVRFHWACLDQCRQRLQGDGGWKPELGATHAAGIVYLSASALFGCTSPPPDIGQRAVQASRHASPWRRAKALPQSRRSVRATSRTASVAEADAGDACSSRVPCLPRRQARP